MADSVEMADIRSLDLDKTVKGFALVNYIFKSAITNSTTTADHIRWYQETAADLTPTAPTVISDVSPLALFPTLEATGSGRQVTFRSMRLKILFLWKT